MKTTTKRLSNEKELKILIKEIVMNQNKPFKKGLLFLFDLIIKLC